MSNQISDSLSDHKYTYIEVSPVDEGRTRYSIVRQADNRILKTIEFQYGPILEAGVNGVMDENLLAIVRHRLQEFQKGEFSCRENAIAITKLEEALLWLNKRKADREARGVEGTHKV